MKKIVVLFLLFISLFAFTACKIDTNESHLYVNGPDEVQLNEEFEVEVDASEDYKITALDDTFKVDGNKITALKEGKGKLLFETSENNVEIEINVVYTYPTDEIKAEYVYLGIVNYGSVKNTDLDNFQYRFSSNGEMSTYSLKKVGNYELHNQLEEGKIYHLEIEGSTITSLEKLDNLIPFEKIKKSSCIEGIIENIDKYQITINSKSYFLLENTQQFKINKAAGGATLTSDEVKVGDNVVITLTEKGYCQNIYKEKATKKLELVVNPTPGERTLTNFFKTAFSAVGHALYVYGGNWDFQDVGSSNYARSIGVSDSWVEFFYEQDEYYNYKNTNAATSYYPFGAFNEYYYAGVDCSGYVGWVMYNVLNTENGNEGFVMGSNKMAKTFAETYKLGTYTKDYQATIDGAKTFKVGDIVSCTGHIWICLGACSDGSLVILHSTPSTSKAGIAGGGAQLGAIGNSESCEAFKLADAYNKKYFKDWADRYPTSLKSYSTYLAQGNTNNGKFSWYLNENGVQDPDGLSEKTPSEILKVIFGE